MMIYLKIVIFVVIFEWLAKTYDVWFSNSWHDFSLADPVLGNWLYDYITTTIDTLRQLWSIYWLIFMFFFFLLSYCFYARYGFTYYFIMSLTAAWWDNDWISRYQLMTIEYSNNGIIIHNSMGWKLKVFGFWVWRF